MTPADRAALDAVAADLGMRPTEFGREWLLRGVQFAHASAGQRKAQREADTVLTARLTKIGKGLNLLTKAANERGEIHADWTTGVADLLSEALGQIAPLAAGQPMTAERKALTVEVTRIGTNVMQLRKVAKKANQLTTVAALDAVNKRIVGAFDRVTPR